MGLVNARDNSIGRAAHMAQLGAGLAGSYLAYQLQRPFLDDRRRSELRQSVRRRNAKRFREKLQDLRGPVMKLGQALSMQTHLLDPDVVAELAGL